jgi:predicted nucleotidyltransferase
MATLTRTSIVEILREQRAELRRFGVDSIALFGSYAKETQTASSSDVDLLVEFSAPTYDNFVRLQEYLEGLLGRNVDILTPAGVESIRIPQVAEDIKRSLVHV